MDDNTVENNNAAERVLSPEERRAHPRKSVRVNKVFSAELILPGAEERSHKCRLYVADASEGGLKITSDFAFEKNIDYMVTLIANIPITFKAEIAWARDLGAGMQALGLKFIELDEENRKILDEFIDYYTAKEKSKVYRLNKIIPMRIHHGTSAPEPFYILTLEISLTGMKISHEARLPENEKIFFRIYLDAHSRPLDVCTKVVSQKEEGILGQTYIINLEFIDIDKDANDYLNNFIDNSISDMIEKKVSRPIVIFDEDSMV
jgi:c-di-GMP-binding flagellar brake protein YcgR